jgi:hypothetical protein
MQFDPKRFSTLDWVIVAGAVIAFIAAFLPWYGASVGPFSASVSGWSAGFSAWAGALLLTAAGALVALRRSGASMSSVGPVGPSAFVVLIAGLGLFLVIIRWLSFPTYHAAGFSANVGARYGIYLALIAGIAEVTAAVMEMRASGEPLPWAQSEHQHEQSEPEPEPEPEAPAAPAAEEPPPSA